MRNMLFLRIPMLCAFVFLLSEAFTQERSLTGTVNDERGDPLPGATITVKNTRLVTRTNVNGEFSIKLPANSNTILVSYVGMQTQEINTAGKFSLEINMKSTNSTLSDVVVIGYGTKRRAEVTSSISSISAKDIKDIPVAGIDQALQGKLAGVTVTNNSGQPGGGVSIRVRGITTINSNDPLIVIDGVPFTSNTNSSSGYAGLGGSNGQTGNSVMATLNPNDIESVDVLKDASAQAIYGSQAANGVILITTKKGKIGEGKINYDVYVGAQEVTRKLTLMNLRQFAQYQNAIVPLIGGIPTPEFQDPSVLGRGTDWQDAIFRIGQLQNHQLSFSGGKDKTTYYLSLNYFDQAGILLGSDFKRYATRFNLDHQLKTWLKIGVSANISRSQQNVTLADAAEGTIWWAGVQSPLVPIKNQNGTWGGGNTIGGFQYGQDNPVATSNNRGNKTINTQIFGNVFAELQILKGLSLKNEVSYSLGMQNNTAFQLAANIGPRTLQSQLFDGRSNSYYYAIRNYLNYNKNFGKHGISATAGHEAQYSYWERISGKKVDLANNILDLNAGNSDKNTWELNGGKSDWAMESYFVRGTYTYDNRYSLTLSFRGDGSANFGPNKKWGYFPGASAGWTVTNEKFAENWQNAFTYLKLRVGYGSVGNQNLPNGAPHPPYTAVVSFWPGPVGFGSSNYLYGIPNPNLGWESVVTQNAGIDAGILKGKIDLTVDVYKKTTTNMLLFSTGPRLIGVGDQWDDLKAPIGNVGQMTNKGIDISVTSHNINTKNLTWNTNLIFSQFTNRLDKLINQASAIDGRIYYDRYLITHTIPGYAVGSFFGLVTDGLFRTPADLAKSLPQFGYTVDPTHTWLGDVRFKDISGPAGKPDNKIDESDITFIGNPLPKFTYGLTNTIQYKEFDFSLFIQGSQGAKIFNFMRWQLEKMDNPYYNQLETVLDRYQTANPNGKLPRFTNTNVNNVYISDRYVEDGSYLRIQNLTVGYRVPKNIIGKALMTNLRFYVSIQNLHTFTKYYGYDPEVGSFDNNIRIMNVDMGHYPNPRTYTFGANLEF